jgi:hypothetical protein
MVATVLALATLGMMIPGAAKAAVSHTLATEGSAVALSALAQDKCDNRERDGERRPNHACENIERGLSAHDAPHCIAEQRLPSLETLCAWRDFVSARIDARFFDAPYEVMRLARSRRRLRLRRSRYRSGRDGAPPVGRSEHRSAAAQQTM